MKLNFFAILLSLLPGLAGAQAVLTAVFDADLPGGLPKGVEFYILEDIADMSHLGIGSANNGQGTDGVEFTFPAMAVDSGEYVYIASDSASFASFFGFNADFISDAMSINGDDAIELFWDSISIDVFGELDVDGTGQPWEYMDGWAARKAFTGPDGATFVLQSWRFSGPNALDTETSNMTAQSPVPLMSYTDTTQVGGPDVTVIAQNLMFLPRDITIEVGQTVRWTNVENFETHNVNGQVSTFPCNPVGFYSGDAALGPWDFDVTFNVPGFYEYQCDPHVSHGMVGTVTVVDPDGPSYPSYDIALVHSEDVSGNADSSGTLCTLQGVVHGINFRPTGLQFTIIDVGASVGINVFKNNTDCYEVTEGDLVSVRGMVTQFNGLTEILPEAQIEVISSDNALMTPVETTEAITENMESTMVLVREITVDSLVSTGASGWNLYGHNAGGVQYLIRLDADVIPDVAGYESGVLDVTGIVGQFDAEEPYTDGYQITPRYPQDIDNGSAVLAVPQSAITLSPNPVAGIFRLETDLQVARVRIYSELGQVVYDRPYTNSSIDISGLSTGSYIIIAETPEGRWTGKLIRG